MVGSVGGGEGRVEVREKEKEVLEEVEVRKVFE